MCAAAVISGRVVKGVSGWVSECVIGRVSVERVIKYLGVGSWESEGLLTKAFSIIGRKAWRRWCRIFRSMLKHVWVSFC